MTAQITPFTDNNAIKYWYKASRISEYGCSSGGKTLLYAMSTGFLPDIDASRGAASAPDFGGGAVDGGGAGGLGRGPFLPLLTGTEAPMLKLVPA